MTATGDCLWRVFGVGLLCAVALPGVSVFGAEGPESIAAARDQLYAVTEPNLDILEPSVADQLRQARTDMEKVIAEPDADRVRLAAAYGTLGQLYHAYELYDEARACYANSAILEPDNYVWMHFQADVSRRQDRLQDAVAEFESARETQPNDFAALIYLGEIYLEFDREEDAEAMFRKALVLYPGSPSAMAGLGQIALRRGQFDDAVAYFKTVLVSVPEADRLHYSLAMAYRGLGRNEEAKEQLALRGTVGLRPPDPVLDSLTPLREGERVHLVRGRMAFASGRYDDARKEFELAVAADPKSARAAVNLGTTLARLGDDTGAVVEYQRALVLDPDSTTAHFNLGAILAGRGDAAAALPHLEKVVEAQPHDAEARMVLARALVADSQDQASLIQFEQASRIDPGSENAVFEGAAALVRLGYYHRAVRVLEAGLERLPGSTHIAFSLTRLLAACPEESVRDGRRALVLALKVFELEPSPRHAQGVAQSLAENGLCDEAADWQEDLVEGALRDGAEDAAAVLTEGLKFYRAGPPCRPPFEDQSRSGD